jgi:hypothetical protein
MVVVATARVFLGKAVLLYPRKPSSNTATRTLIPAPLQGAVTLALLCNLRRLVVRYDRSIHL